MLEAKRKGVMDGQDAKAEKPEAGEAEKAAEARQEPAAGRPEAGEAEKAAETSQESAAEKPKISETWAEETIADLDEFIESQGIYIRQ